MPHRIAPRLQALLALLWAALAAAAPLPVSAVEPDEVLSDAKLEARARELSAELRCLVCQNQSIDDSSAPLARDLRLLVRERLKAGETDREVLDFIVARYGDFVLLRPPFGISTLLLWLAPLAALAAAVSTAWSAARRRRRRSSTAADAALTPTEEAKLRALLGDPARQRDDATHP
jgi:cytochrome c-type biogenesis protein CcmH